MDLVDGGQNPPKLAAFAIMKGNYVWGTRAGLPNGDRPDAPATLESDLFWVGYGTDLSLSADFCSSVYGAD